MNISQLKSKLDEYVLIIHHPLPRIYAQVALANRRIQWQQLVAELVLPIEAQKLLSKRILTQLNGIYYKRPK
jgi:hypothetical protein